MTRQYQSNHFKTNYRVQSKRSSNDLLYNPRPIIYQRKSFQTITSYL